MPTTREPKNKGKRFREAEMLSDIDHVDISLVSSLFEKDDSEFCNDVSRPESPRYNTLANIESNYHSISRDNGIRGFAGNGLNQEVVESGSEIDKLSYELNLRITQEMNRLMSSVSQQIQRAIKEAIIE